MTRFNWKFYRDFTVWAERRLLEKAKGAKTEQQWVEFGVFARDTFEPLRLLLKPLGEVLDLFQGNWYDIPKIVKRVLGYLMTNPDPLRKTREAIKAAYLKYGDPPASFKPTMAGFGATEDPGDVHG